MLSLSKFGYLQEQFWEFKSSSFNLGPYRESADVTGQN